MSKNYITPLLFVLFALVFTGCATLPIVKSSPDTITENSVYKYYDSKSQIRYLVSNDDKNLHISFKTVHQPTIAKILRAGLTIYFDKNGKKHKDVYVNYPMGSPAGFESIKPSQGNQGANDVKTLINSTSIAAEYTYFNDKTSFTTNQTNSGIQLTLSSQNPKELVYDMVIPFTKIAPNGKADLFNLSIGIVTGSFEMPTSPPQDAPSGGRQSVGGEHRSQQPGAMSQNTNYSGGGKSGGRQSGRPPHEGFSELSEDSKVWFQVGLYR